MAPQVADPRNLRDQSVVAHGFWLTFPSAAVAKTILHRPTTEKSRFSWVLIDAEHGLITDRDYYELSNAVASEGAIPIIRVPWGEEWMIKRALDAGAHGILTPMCHTEADAAKIVSYVKYPPLGTRGYGPMFASHSFPSVLSDNDYEEVSQNGIIVMVQIESKSGVENVEKIAKVEGLDGLLIGPFDLAKHLNVPRGGEEHEAAIKRILAATKAAGKRAAIFCTGGADARARIEQGFDMVSVITDVGLLGDAMQHELDVASGQKEADGSKAAGNGGY
ncbi:HpcH/HpaI aldolase family protein [Aspergillus homomorphus CBS 101889]|uniref:Phosphoenolpyruvate/pyruvate domain-containing protein n=1 Tax=Aspergillus homomorphus (strain CBS 101889) TaxID=1450537 RepID=A0A395HFU1_ASPHC|nr:Phosphoenolpyruvate/pyruvate domain-containing protein [Aspergillus homomorphus CBS 101889]RAL06600.1 Phosphoenolpyruvate/pyruvate domain-containing protein [Aspergillus homomorphus CBS 101889]